MSSIISNLKKKFWIEQWNVGITKVSQDDLLVKEDFSHGKVQWLFPEKKNGFYADPFLISRGGKNYLFFEEFDGDAQRGFISYSVLREGGDGNILASDPKVAISKPFHMSYPFLFEHGDDLYMIPETAEANEVALYKPASFPDVWMKAKTLISNFPALDSTLVFWEAKYWLFCTHQKNGENSELHIFYADDIFGSWQSHGKNPVKIDLKGSRPGGKFFEKDGKLFRFAQDCSETYGGNLVLAEVEKLTEEEFLERTIKTINPRISDKYDKGLHTLNFSGKWAVIDGKRFVGIKNYLNDHVQSAKKKFKKR